MYDYRRMTAEQRRAIVDLRRSRGFPLHKPPHKDYGEGWYLISAATYEHRPYFTLPTELTALVTRLHEALRQSEINLAGWVVMPNHYHLLASLTRTSVAGRVLGPVHGRSGFYANQRDSTPGRRVWYKYSDRMIRSERHYWTSLHYIIFNPVKHGYASAIGEWPWSCYHELVASQREEWVDDLQREYPLREYGRGWDD